jgi:hypothetical protein
MKTSLARTNAILPIEAASDLTGHIGRFVILQSGKAVLVTSASQKPFGVLLTDGKAGERVSVAVGAGGLSGVIRVKLTAAVSNPGMDLQVNASGGVQPDAGSGARVIVAQSLESGTVNELIEAVLIRPVALT